jgi:putative spermidine/putrescine transport system permease protein
MNRRFARTLAAVALLAPVFLVLLAPIAVIALGSLDDAARAYVAIPPKDLGIASYFAIKPRYWAALQTSVLLGLTAAAAASLVGVPAALGLVRGRMPGKEIILVILRAPLQIPALVLGVSFLEMYYAIGQATGWYAQDSFLGLAIAHSFAVTPYVVGTLVSVLQRYDASIEEAAIILGASPTGTLWQVTLPLLRPGLFAGALYAFATSFSEVPITVFLSGSHITTFPVEVFNTLQFDFDPSILAISTIVTIISLLTVYAMQRLLGLQSFLNIGAAE